MRFQATDQLRQSAEGCGLKSSIVLSKNNHVGNIPSLELLVQRGIIASGINSQHKQLADLLTWRQLSNICIDALVQSSSRNRRESSHWLRGWRKGSRGKSNS